jgi:hypothetical protein
VRDREVLIEIGPSKTEDLASAHAGREGNRGRDLKCRSFGGCKDPSRELGIDHPRLASLRTWRLGTGDGVRRDESPPDRLPEGVVEHEVQIQDRSGRKRRFTLEQVRVGVLHVQRLERL